MRPYENFNAFGMLSRDGLHAAAEQVVRCGFSSDGFHLRSLEPPIPWNDFPRPFMFRLHSWEPINGLLRAHSTLNSKRSLEVALAFALDWLDKFQATALVEGVEKVLSARTEIAERFEWYDMAVGLRIYRLAYLAEALAELGPTGEARLSLFLDALRFHHEVLSTPDFFRSHTNHGLYQALGQLAASYRLTEQLCGERFRELARKRLSACIERHFFSTEGVHKEHSPGYHYMVVSSLVGAARAGLLSLEQLDLIGRAEEALAWMIMPGRQLVPIGDTDHRPIFQACIVADELRSDALKFLLTGGSAGTSPEPGVRAFSQAGYAFARLYDLDAGQSYDTASYLAQIAAYHSRVHKHADHLSFVWSEGACSILTDPGRFGYFGRTTRGDGLYEQGFWYSDPRRIYAESTRAHNCVEVDGRSFPRLNTAIFGSGLRQAEMQDGLAIFDSQFVFRPSLVCRRTLILAPKEFLVVVDWLFDRRGTAHDFRQWFTMTPGWSVANVGRCYEANNAEIALGISELLADSSCSEVFVGSENPLQGWTSLEPSSLTPSPSFNFCQMNTANAKFATVFSLTGFPKRDVRTRSNASMSRAILAWGSDSGPVRLELERSTRLSVRRARD